MSERLPYGRHSIDSEDVRAVVEALESGWLTEGPARAAFEAALAEATGARFAVALANGTLALQAAYFAAGLGPGNALLTSPITFAATAHAAWHLGADIRFADIDPESALLDPEDVARRLSPDVRVLAPVHLAGQPCDMPALRSVADRVGALVVEDACHALGAELFDPASGEWTRVGACRHSDMTVFSFHPVKHVAMGEGGAVTTNDEELARRVRLFGSQGIEHDPDRFDHPPEGPWSYEVQVLGTNARASELHCALGRSQLTKLPRFLARRREIARRYTTAFDDLTGLRPLAVRSVVRPAWHLYGVRLDLDRLAWSRLDLVEALDERGIGTAVHYAPVHLQPLYRKERGFRPGDFPRAEAYADCALTLPLFPSMTDTDVERVISAVREVLSDPSR